MNFRRLATTLLLLLLPAISQAGVTYHLDNGKPAGTGLYAEIEFASPPASATSGWSVPTASGTVLDLTLFNVTTTGERAFSAVVFRTGPTAPFGPVGSDTGATLDFGSVTANGNASGGNSNFEAAVLDFDAHLIKLIFFHVSAGKVTGTDFVTQSGTWVLGPAPSPVPEPSSLILLATGLASLAAWCRRGAA